MVQEKQKKQYKVQAEISGQSNSALRRYQDLVIGTRKWWDLFLYEFIQLFASWVPGALGLLLRKWFYPLLLGSCGKGVVFGKDVVLRHPRKIHLRRGVILDDGVMLDAKGGEESGIVLEDDVFIGRNSILSCKDGRIHLGKRSNIGFHSEIFSSSQVTIGEDVMVAAYCYLLGGGSYKTDRLDIPMNQQYDFEGKGGVTLEDNVWLGAHVVVFDGVTIATGSVIGANGLVNRNVASNVIAVGQPARAVSNRDRKS